MVESNKKQNSIKEEYLRDYPVLIVRLSEFLNEKEINKVLAVIFTTCSDCFNTDETNGNCYCGPQWDL